VERSHETNIFTRLRDVMKDKYNIRDKFVLVASELEAANADGDIGEFKELEDERDAIHEIKIAPDARPTADACLLLRKYLELHLARLRKSWLRASSGGRPTANFPSFGAASAQPDTRIPDSPAGPAFLRSNRAFIG
jgi:hypothetical protein